MEENFELIRSLVKKHHGFDCKDKSRVRGNVDARKLFVVAVFQKVKRITYQKIADFLNLENHVTIMHHKKTGEDLIEVDLKLKKTFKKIIEDYFELNKDVLEEELKTEIVITEKKLKKLKNRLSEFSI